MGKYQQEKTSVKIDELLKKPEALELNAHCIKSIKYKHNKKFKKDSTPKFEIKKLSKSSENYYNQNFMETKNQA